jgi:photosystem II stability/assembly factor-like uncharacterized protein
MIHLPTWNPRHCTAVAVLLLTFWLTGANAAVGQWTPTTTELLAKEKPGFGGLCGVVIDHRTGHLIVNVSDRGFFRSEDQGKSWKRLGDKTIKGRTEWPGCLQLDPVGDGKTLISALVYGEPIAIATDGGATWRFLDKKSSHIDWCAVDWTDADMKFILALKHESGDLLLRSVDGGKTFEEVGKGYGPAWIFDSKTAVVAEAGSKTNPKPGLLRTTDGGKTFQPCAAYAAKALPRWHQGTGTLYWLVAGALLTTTDKGENWKKVCDLKDGRFGPVFGKEAKHLFVLTGAGIVESTDGGETWAKAIAVPKELKGVSALTWMEYDPVHDVLYVMKMGSELFKLERGKN